MERDLDHVGRIMEQWRRERPDLDPSPMGIIGRLHRLADALHTELRPVFAEAGLSDGDFDVLAALRRRDAMLLLLWAEDVDYAALAAAIGVRTSSVGTVLRRAQDAFRKDYEARYGHTS